MKKVLIGLLLTTCFLYANGFVLGGIITIFKDKEFGIFTISEKNND